jgi:predicted ATPase with chaperone activity
VSEAKERVRAALVASGLALPARRTTVNLAPADLPKEGSHYDLPIALGLMAAIGAVPQDAISGFTVLGELGLDGGIAPVAGVLPTAIGANARGQGLICPAACGPEAAWASPEIDIVAAQSLIQLANHRITYPARFMLVAAMNPCRCGRANDPGFACKRGPNTRCVAEYQSRLSGPLLDRIDLHIEVPAVTAADLILPPPSEGSREVAARVARARDIQLERYAALGLENVRTNTQAHGSVLEHVARADGSGLALLRDAADRCTCRRAAITACRASRTRWPISTAPKKIGHVHFAEALSYRALADEVRRAA